VSELVVEVLVFRLLPEPEEEFAFEFAGSTSSNVSGDLLTEDVSVLVAAGRTRRGRVEPLDCAWTVNAAKRRREVKEATVRSR
jgi:hypothetical protein